ncbi:MAG: AmmeMemoRadiSam system radical SAM enzyme [Candidatus Krumholzibacteria bacterium]|nr:AmmeMemoRadiSam system radical SAM enzyme [Candidatus Krumholzibacteria bacterium]
MITGNTREALFYEKLDDGRVRCLLCPNLCVVGNGSAGRCMVRKNESGKLLTLSYGNTVTVAIDPIEKKPLYHFMPGSQILSIGPNGCTLTCDHCQNWQISQEKAPVRYLSPEELVELGGRDGSAGVAFTYTEPLVWFEYLLDALPLLTDAGLKSVLVTNGYLNEEPARQIVPLVDAFNVDLKSFNDSFYRKYCGGSIEPVMAFIELAAEHAHVEVTCLIIPGLNDTEEEIAKMARWLSGISREIPLHLSRFFPRFRMDGRPPTPQETLEMAFRTAREYLDYVYVGNIFIEGTENTVCPSCGADVILRSGYSAELRAAGGICTSCGHHIKGVWS